MVASIDIHLEEVIKYGRLLGQKKDCSYYPCHFDGQDCTWCFCPFYPCNDDKTGGSLTIGMISGKLVWGCGRCHWIHRPEVALFILKNILKIIEREESLTNSQLLELRNEALRAYPP